MFKPKAAFSSFSVDDTAKAKEFYTSKLGLEIRDDKMGLSLVLPGGAEVFVYQKDTHEPATFTVLNLAVENIDKAMEELEAAGIQFERYEGMSLDEKGILRGLSENMGPDIAWFTDPAGNVISIMQDSPSEG
jgi:predicted enzyme related to lactoylglutathione lyase